MHAQRLDYCIEVYVREVCCDRLHLSALLTSFTFSRLRGEEAVLEKERSEEAPSALSLTAAALQYIAEPRQETRKKLLW